jgi:hypothetical protein
MDVAVRDTACITNPLHSVAAVKAAVESFMVQESLLAISTQVTRSVLTNLCKFGDAACSSLGCIGARDSSMHRVCICASCCTYFAVFKKQHANMHDDEHNRCGY